MDIGLFIVLMIVVYVVPELLKRMKKKKPYQKSRTFHLKRIDFRADVNDAPDLHFFYGVFLEFCVLFH